MAITTDGFFDWVEQKPGPPHKVYQTFSNEGFVGHSQEGWQAGSEGRLFDLNDDASWHVSLLLTGLPIQHYPLTVGTWTSGSLGWNTRYWTVELEGTVGKHPEINDAQMATLFRMFGDWERWSGRYIWRTMPNDLGLPRTWFEHRQNPDASPTACPSGRYDRAIRTWEDSRMGLIEDLMLAIASGNEENALPRDERLTNARYRIGRIAAGEDPSALDQARSAISLSVGLAAEFEAHETNHAVQGEHGHRISLPIDGTTGGPEPLQ